MKHSGLREVEVERWMGMDMDRRGLGTVGRKRRRCEAKKETLTPDSNSTRDDRDMDKQGIRRAKGTRKKVTVSHSKSAGLSQLTGQEQRITGITVKYGTEGKESARQNREAGWTGVIC
ncbi:hypothetical protein NXS19_000470 [Fusarium pseudograminearum]|nr:hypothetical protein NXS19_000470 [Fusarium pseudograminearum]